VSFLESLVEYSDVLLQFLLLVLLVLHSNYRRYLLLFAYCVLLFSTTVLEWWSFTHGAPIGSARYSAIYWRNEMILDLFLFLMVIGLTSQAMGESPRRDKVRLVLVIVSGIVLLLPLVIFPSRFGPLWYYSTSQFFNFGGAVLNLALWMALLSNRKRDRRLLAVSTGLGIAVTGAAIAFGLRQFTSVSGFGRPLVDMFKSGTHAIGMVIWCLAFLPRPKPPAATRPAIST
jgi:hypothetical membrane protein